MGFCAGAGLHYVIDKDYREAAIYVLLCAANHISLAFTTKALDKHRDIKR